MIPLIYGKSIKHQPKHFFLSVYVYDIQRNFRRFTFKDLKMVDWQFCVVVHYTDKHIPKFGIAKSVKAIHDKFKY